MDSEGNVKEMKHIKTDYWVMFQHLDMSKASEHRPDPLNVTAGQEAGKLLKTD